MQVDGEEILSCLDCGHHYLGARDSESHVAQVFGDDYFLAGGVGYPDYLAEGALLRAHGLRYARLLDTHLECGTVLDVGCAAGFILQGFEDHGWRCQGVEPNGRMAAFARRELGLEVEEGTFEGLGGADPVDLILMIQVLAHFVDTLGAFEKARRLTRPGGHLLLETWNRTSWTARIFGKRWHEYSPQSVVHWFSREGLIGLAESHGYRLVASGRPHKWIGGAHAKSLLSTKIGRGWLGRMTQPLLSVIPDSAAIPYPAEDLLWVLLRRA